MVICRSGQIFALGLAVGHVGRLGLHPQTVSSLNEGSDDLNFSYPGFSSVANLEARLDVSDLIRGWTLAHLKCRPWSGLSE